MNLPEQRNNISLELLAEEHGLKTLLSKIGEYSHKIPDRMTDFQIRNFLVGGEVLDSLKIKRCLIESRVRVENLESLLLDLELKRIDLEEQIHKRREIKDDYESRRQHILSLKKEREIAQIKRAIDSQIEELEIFSNILEEIDISAINTKEEEEWETKFRRQLSLSFLTHGGTSPDLAESILKMPSSSGIRHWLEQNLDRLENNSSEEGCEIG